MNTNKKGVILLSGGLDSFVSLDMAKKICDIELALTFNYNQKAFLEEKEAASKICKLYNINHKIIDIPYLADISNNTLTNPDKNDFNDFNSVWIPNRNGLFLNIAACFCDKFNWNYIIIGANKEEAKDFPDNTKEFIKEAKNFFKYSTLNKVEVLSPCVDMDKIEIINYAIDNSLNFSLLKSCYNSKEKTNKKHCGVCMSCRLLKNALEKSKKPELTGEIF